MIEFQGFEPINLDDSTHDPVELRFAAERFALQAQWLRVAAAGPMDFAARGRMQNEIADAFPCVPDYLMTSRTVEVIRQDPTYIVGDLHAIARNLELYALIAHNKASSISLRTDGAIDMARVHDDAIEQYYNMLDPWARW